ncbi:MAG: DUF479 domain-containing protein [Bacteroidetes bacterium]|nr:DUF479 domain-containing protein [Bacteroidota bacterium]
MVDLYYDHFLACNSPDIRAELEEYSHQTYRTIKEYSEILPEGVNYFLPFMIERNWLLNYKYNRAWTCTHRFIKRVSFENKMDESVADLKEHYALFEMNSIAFPRVDYLCALFFLKMQIYLKVKPNQRFDKVGKVGNDWEIRAKSTCN